MFCYRAGKDPIYAATYFMMKDIWQIAGDSKMKTFLQHAVYTDSEEKRMRIDINQWLKTLPVKMRQKILTSISMHAPMVIQTIGQRTKDYIFTLPSN